MVQETINIYDKIDVLVCNAATNPAFGPIANLDDNAFDKINQVCNIFDFDLDKMKKEFGFTYNSML